MKKSRKKIELNKTKEGKHVNIFLIFTVTLVMLVLSVGSFLLPDREKSDNENRYLTQAPKFSVENVLEGKFESQLEEYLSDLIIGREKWIKIMSTTLKSIGYNDANGVYMLKDGRLIERKTQAEFREDRFILHQPTQAVSDICLAACQEAGFTPHIICRNSAAPISANLVRAGLGVSFFTKEEAENFLDEGLVSLSLKKPIRKEIVMVCPKAHEPSRLVGVFTDFVSKWLKKHEGPANACFLR